MALLAEPRYCFVAGALVATEVGLRPIEEVAVGETPNPSKADLLAYAAEIDKECFPCIIGAIRISRGCSTPEDSWLRGTFS